MKIKDIILERKSGKLSKRLQQPTRGLHKFQDHSGRDRFYELYRVMLATAASNGVDPIPDHVKPESWVGVQNLAAPMTDIEHKMLHQAYKIIGSDHYDLNDGDLRSLELDSTNKASPVPKRKKNRYGV